MRAVISLLALSCVGASLLPTSQQVSIAFVVAAIVMAASAIGSYVASEVAQAVGPRRRNKKKRSIDMSRYSRPIPVGHAESRRVAEREGRGASSL